LGREHLRRIIRQGLVRHRGNLIVWLKYLL
jgi:hypothetical protein